LKTPSLAACTFVVLLGLMLNRIALEPCDLTPKLIGVLLILSLFAGVVAFSFFNDRLEEKVELLPEWEINCFGPADPR
jgi:hypothetical protein